MKTILQKVKDGIAATLKGQTVEQMEDEARQAAVKSAVDEYLIRYPDWEPSTKVISVKDSKQKATKVFMKTLGAGAGAGTFIPHVVDQDALQRAREAARAFQAADPERYGYIITASPIKGV
ncbi:hypothetical protein VSX61_12090 [Brenneria populi subsp. brevivirga]|uniref:hypothetical protein n=1 Tax=Brenneria populi TaxID=1505588 RepID=UPI002E19B6BC|nr:hypothetical protein [Brenneria populi subsp. brevivirga]